MLAHALDPSRHLQGLRHLSGDYFSKEALITKFMALCLRLGLPTEGNINQNPNALAETIQTAMDYFDGGPRPLLDLKLGTVPGTHKVEAVARWARSVDHAGTALPVVAQPLLSISAHAAELERIWSAMGLAKTKLRSRLDMGRLRKMTRVCMQMREAVASKSRTGQLILPGASSRLVVRMLIGSTTRRPAGCRQCLEACRRTQSLSRRPVCPAGRCHWTGASRWRSDRQTSRSTRSCICWRMASNSC